MDPVTALGLAAAILQFVGVSWSLIQDAKEIYDSADGALHENASTEVVIDDLERIAGELSKSETCAASTAPEQALKKIGGYCQDDAKKLLGHLKKLKVGEKQRPWKIIKAAFWNRFSKGDIAELKENLNYYRSEINTNLLLIIRQDQVGVGAQLTRLHNECEKLQMRFFDTITTIRQDLANVIEANRTADVLQMLGKLEIMAQTIPIQHRILRQLHYEDYSYMRTRRSQIHDASRETCSWMLEDHDGSATQYRDKTSRAFRSWMLEYRDGSAIQLRYKTSRAFRRWLREGKKCPAYLGQRWGWKIDPAHHTTSKELQIWAGVRTLVVAEYYFYIAGTIMERTLPGLYRSLLFQILSRCPDIIPLVFPTQWQENIAGIRERIMESRGLTDAEIKTAFENLMSSKVHKEYKFCFFIDGLDEYQGDGVGNEEMARENLAEMLMKWTTNDHVKICASSRPNREFHELFCYPENPTIHLHHMNEPDIWMYCIDRFQKDREASKIKDVSPYMDLIYYIANNSRGVFLWAYLVIDDLLAGIRLGYSLETLKESLKQVPLALEKLYESMRNGLSKNNRRMSDKMLLIAAEKPFKEPLYAIDYAWLEAPDDLADPNFPDITISHLYSEEEVKEKLAIVQKRLASLTKGLLEVVVDNRHTIWHQPEYTFHGQAVQFFHRTARDYIIETPGLLQALKESFPLFHETYPYARLRLAEYSRVFGHECLLDKRRTFHDTFHDIIEHDIKELTYTYPKHLREIGDAFYLAIQKRLQDCQITENLRAVPRGALYYGASSVPQLMNCPGSLVHCMALYGFDDVVLSKINEEPQLKRTTGDLNILITAIRGRRWELALEVLDRGVELGDLISVGNEANRLNHKSNYPVWFVAAISTIEQYFWQFSLTAPDEWPSAEILQRLVEHGTSKGETFIISFSLKNPVPIIEYSHLPHWPGYQFNASRSLRPSQVNSLPVADLASFFSKVMSCDSTHGPELSDTTFTGSTTFGAFLSLLLGVMSVYNVEVFHSSYGFLQFDGEGFGTETRAR